MKIALTRRNILQNAAKGALGLVASTAMGPLFFYGCRKSDDSPRVARPNLDVESCPNQESLSEQEIAIRNSLKYVDSTPVSGRTCDNCKLYTLPASATICGGCKVVPGPIHAKGYCTAWLHRM